MAGAMAVKPFAPEATVGAGRVALDAWVRRHWLLLATLGNAAVLAGAVWVAYLRAHGATQLAETLSTAYLLLCPQRPAHSYFPFGAQMALEEREVAMFATLALGGAVYGAVRGRLRPIKLRMVLVLGAPMVLDVVTQMVGLRDSTWLWRTWTGILATWSVIWYVYPRVDWRIRLQQARPAGVGSPRPRDT